MSHDSVSLETKEKNGGQKNNNSKLPQVGFEPMTSQLTADRSTTELLRKNFLKEANSCCGKRHPYYTLKPEASVQRLFRLCCLLLASSKISLSPRLPVSILIDSLLPFAQARNHLLCCISWSSFSFPLTTIPLIFQCLPPSPVPIRSAYPLKPDTG